MCRGLRGLQRGLYHLFQQSKTQISGCQQSTLKRYGAVSEQTAREMATGGVFATDSDACVAVTGLAGPDGGSEEKPVGLVYIATYA